MVAKAARLVDFEAFSFLIDAVAPGVLKNSCDYDCGFDRKEINMNYFVRPLGLDMQDGLLNLETKKMREGQSFRGGLMPGSLIGSISLRLIQASSSYPFPCASIKTQHARPRHKNTTETPRTVEHASLSMLVCAIFLL